MRPKSELLNYTGSGIYTVGEASLLSRVSTARIRRWLLGYRFNTSGQLHESLPVWQPQLPEIDGKLALGFLDLMEMRFVDAFLKEGVSWRTLRLAANKARDLFKSTHPFCTRKFKTDGRQVFAEISDHAGDRSLLELVRSQLYFHKTVSPFLRGVEFEDDEPVRWRPLEGARQIVLDPNRSFGQPVVDHSGVPTLILARAAKVNRSFEEVAEWYRTDVRAVRAAVEYERQLHRKKEAA